MAKKNDSLMASLFKKFPNVGLSFFSLFLFLFLSHSVQLYEKVKMTKTLEKLTRLTNCILFVAPKMSAERERKDECREGERKDE